MTTALSMPTDSRPATRSRNDTIIFGLACAASLIFLVISATARVPTYRINPIFLIPLAWSPYWLRRRLHLYWAHYALLIVAFLLHDVGAYGFYQHSPLPFSWDILVHYYFAIPVTLIMHRAIAVGYATVLRPWQAMLVALLFMMGMGAIHEIMEYMTYLVLGEERGMLKPSTSYFFDTQRDLTNNLLGTLTALMLATIARSLSRRPSDGARLPAVDE
jgi:uncharacterized membrane protein YjdF